MFYICTRIKNNIDMDFLSSPGGSIKAAALKAMQTGFTLMAGILFLGIGYGIYMRSCGFGIIFPVCMAATIFAGSMEFITAGLLLGSFNPLYAFLLTLIVNGRHLFYGLSIFEKYKNTGWKKPWLISGLIDESFSVNYITKLPPNVNQDWFMFFITLFLYLFWVAGTTIGALCGSVATVNIKGIDFVMPALFIVIFISQWQKESSHSGSLMGVILSGGCLLLFGKTYFLLPSLLLFALLFSIHWLLTSDKKSLL